MAASDQLLVVIDPVARRSDGESVRIAKDVLSAGAVTKFCLPDGPEEFAKALARRGSRRPVVVGDDRALARAVALLHREREPASAVLSLVPVGASLSLAEALGVPTGAVAAARAVLEGVERRLDLLVDDRDGVVLGDLRIPPLRERPAASDGGAGASASGSGGFGPAGHAVHWLLSTAQSLVRALAIRPPEAASPPQSAAAPARLRIEVDGVTLIDLDQPVEAVSVTRATAGQARIEVRPSSVGAEAATLHALGRNITVSGADFRYRADAVVAGPVRSRTWTVLPRAWGLTVPAGQRACLEL